MEQNILITGGAGFIGSHLVHHMVNQYPNSLIVNLDALTYAGNLENLKDLEGKTNYRFVKADIGDAPTLQQIFQDYQINRVINLAAESHVDRSIHDPLAFAQTNILGTMTLLNAAKEAWQKDYSNKRYYQVSTDEVYGALLPGEAAFTETTHYSPRSPYAASKASADHFVRAYHHTYGLPVVLSCCSNNYGPYQFPEKLIPLFINNIIHQKPLPVYGQGLNVRDWLYVEDHVEAIDLILQKGQDGATYNIGGNNEWSNIDLIKELIRIVDAQLGNPEGHSSKLITFVADRLGHDFRYAINASRLANELGWQPKQTFTEGLEKTVRWYLSHPEWLANVTSGAYQKYYDNMYRNR